MLNKSLNSEVTSSTFAKKSLPQEKDMFESNKEDSQSLNSENEVADEYGGLVNEMLPHAENPHDQDSDNPGSKESEFGDSDSCSTTEPEFDRNMDVESISSLENQTDDNDESVDANGQILTMDNMSPAQPAVTVILS